MRVLVTGSAGHLGEALLRTLRDGPHTAVGLDCLPSPFTDAVGSLVERSFLHDAVQNVDAVIHAATLHKPHVATHARQAFVDVNVSGTLNLLEQACATGVQRFVFISTTSTFGHALVAGPGQPAAWITEQTRPVPRNIYGVTKQAAEDLCQLMHQDHGLPCVVLKVARFFPEQDDDPAARASFDPDNLKLNELLHRRLDLADAVTACLRALERAPEIGFERLIVSATTPFTPDDRELLCNDPSRVLRRRFPDFEALYAARGWRMAASIGRVYDNARARRVLGWEPTWDFGYALACLREERDFKSDLARAVGAKGYHREA